MQNPKLEIRDPKESQSLGEPKQLSSIFGFELRASFEFRVSESGF